MIGVLIRVRSYATMVPAGAICASACALIWMAGLPREARGPGNFGRSI
jgi:hypothetical protein